MVSILKIHDEFNCGAIGDADKGAVQVVFFEANETERNIYLMSPDACSKLADEMKQEALKAKGITLATADQMPTHPLTHQPGRTS